MTSYRCSCYKEKNLRYFIDTATSRYASYISEKIQQEREQKELKVARAEEDAARLRRELLEVKSRERLFARRDLAANYSSSHNPLSLNFFLSYENPILASVDVSNSTYVPVTCSSLGFL
ncbi:hypothetical protein COCSADRAFT_36255 [Bipolaris sorokiniana ND90Pr]|uniref:Uncharacterized protein n=1 Tax=Cochliobolus sativus (strain ND90Pr / ATCC 201652) TaxID=665912 RepID=M2SC49_COCSN|nr:uncharacterized protein COCSADRAFT_36255 [Bipolaris sorokiniana ND90Pr]EMD64888.1 hypothetical protein COCSADRAFT_36255 [Bipolaris sorokiniana ND90Pr]